MTYQPGEDVTVTFDGIDHPGTVERIENGWIQCRIIIDPDADYGSGTERLDPEQTVCVRSDKVKSNK
jgi:hypothetical protein